MLHITNFGFYSIAPDYLQHLHNADSEVYYNASYHNSMKPFVGVIIGLEEYAYFIPLSSAKTKHIGWKNVTDEHFLVYEMVDSNTNFPNQIYKASTSNEKMHILAVLDIKKMIPVPSGCFERIEFEDLQDRRYYDLFRKEYRFCLNIKEKILAKAQKLYQKQKKTGVVQKRHCTFSQLESAMREWQKLHSIIPSST